MLDAGHGTAAEPALRRVIDQLRRRGLVVFVSDLLFDRPRIREIGENARELVRQSFLNTRHLREYLTLMVALLYGLGDRIELE